MQDGRHQGLHVGVVAVVVRGERIAEPGVILLPRRPPRLPLAQGRVSLGHFRETPQDESQLDRHGPSHHRVPSLSKTATRSAGGT